MAYTPVLTIRMADANTAFGQALPIGTVVYDQANIKTYVAKIALLSTENISTAFPGKLVEVGISTLVGLSDTPTEYDSGDINKTLRVNSTPNGIEFVSAGANLGAAVTTTSPTTSPVYGDYYDATQEGFYPNFGHPATTVYVGETLAYDGTNWIIIPKPTGIEEFIKLTDTPSTYGTQGQVPVINATTDGLAWGYRANLNGNSTQIFQVKDGVNANDAVNVSQLQALGAGLTFSGNWDPALTSSEPTWPFPDETLTTPTDIGKFWVCNRDGYDKSGQFWDQGDWIVFQGPGTGADAADWGKIPNLSANEFLDLNDTPSSYTGQANKIVAVNSDGGGPDGSALEFIEAPPETFTGLTDTPANYTAQAGKWVRVAGSGDGTGLEFVTAPKQIKRYDTGTGQAGFVGQVFTLDETRSTNLTAAVNGLTLEASQITGSGTAITFLPPLTIQDKVIIINEV